MTNGLYEQDNSFQTRLQQFKIIYLFMSIDDDISQANMAFINQLAGDLKLSSNEFQMAVNVCKEIIGGAFDKDDRPNLIREKIAKLGTMFYEAEKILALWSLVNCAFKDGECSPNKKHILRALTRDWEIEDNVAVLTEMEDTAEALLALEQHKEWIKTTNYPYDYTHSVIEVMEKNKQELSNNISLLASIG